MHSKMSEFEAEQSKGYQLKKKNPKISSIGALKVQSFSIRPNCTCKYLEITDYAEADSF